MRHPYTPIRPSAAEREEMATGFARPYDMDHERHVPHGFDEPYPWHAGPFAWRTVCDCGQPIYGRTKEACEAHGLAHMRGER